MQDNPTARLLTWGFSPSAFSWDQWHPRICPEKDLQENRVCIVKCCRTFPVWCRRRTANNPLTVRTSGLRWTWNERGSSRVNTMQYILLNDTFYCNDIIWTITNLTTCRFAHRSVRSSALRGPRSRACRVFLARRPLRSGTWICRNRIVLRHSSGSRRSALGFVAVKRRKVIVKTPSIPFVLKTGYNASTNAQNHALVTARNQIGTNVFESYLHCVYTGLRDAR